jgi:hypothetical protein
MAAVQEGWFWQKLLTAGWFGRLAKKMLKWFLNKSIFLFFLLLFGTHKHIVKGLESNEVLRSQNTCSSWRIQQDNQVLHVRLSVLLDDVDNQLAVDEHGAAFNKEGTFSECRLVLSINFIVNFSDFNVSRLELQSVIGWYI